MEVVAERYELEEVVGVGGMSRVYRARDRSLERIVALKLLHSHYAQDEDYVQRFRSEARAVAQLSHPNIVTVIDRGEAEDGTPFIVFEYIEGQTLRDLVATQGPLSVRQVLELGIQIGRALAFAHESGLVHRDVKPQNVLLNGDGRAKVTDFGIARSLDVEHGMTQTGTVLGTSNYISPEQARGERVAAPTDIYSLGAVLFELLTGRPLFEGENFVAVAMQHVTQPAPSILERRPDCPLRLASAIERSLAKLPGDRFPTMDAYVAELEACLAQIGEEPELDATVIRPSPVLRQGRRRHVRAGSRSWLLATLALLLLAGALGAYALLRDTDGNESPQGTPVAAVRLAGAGALDPHGDANEHPEDAASAADRDPATYWRTEIYESGLAKPGVGLVLQAGTPRTLRTLTVVTDTPGFTAEIRTAGSADGAAEPGPVIARAKPVTGTTTFTLKPSASNYWVVWITDLGSNGVVHVNEVRARGQ